MAEKTKTQTAVDPASQFSNPARQYPTKVALDVDAAFANGCPPEPSLPHGGAGFQDPAKQAAAYQEWADWRGVLNQIDLIKGNGAEPDDTKLKQIAFNSGVTFTYRGGKYYNKADGGVYIPG